MSQETEVADAHEPPGKHVQEKAPQELLYRQGQEALLVSVGGVSPAKGDLVTDQRDETMVGDSNAMGVGAQIVKDIFWPPEGRFAVDDPVPTEEWAQERGESLGRGERLQLAVEAQLALGEGLFQSGDELAPKDSPEHLDGKKEAIARGDPALVIGRETTGRNDTMQMGMRLEFLTPGMEHAEEADFGAEMAGIARHFEQRFGTGPE
jgi:hypothetical protein